MVRRSPLPIRLCRRHGYTTLLLMCGLVFLVLAIHVTKNQFILIVDVHNHNNPLLPGETRDIISTSRHLREYKSKDPSTSSTPSPYQVNITQYSEERFQLLMETIQALKIYNNTFDGNYTKDDYRGKTCVIYKNEAKLERVVASNIWVEKNTYFEDDVTLVTQFTLEKATALNILLGHWNGPISATLYVGWEQLNNIPIMFKGFPKILSRDNLDLHIVLKNGTMYPVNYLRNVAINNTVTPYVFLIDVDFMPSYGLYEYLMEYIPTRHGLHKEGIVIPAMEYLMQAGMFFPQNKTELLFLQELGVIVTSEKIHWVPSHRPTNYSFWFTSTEPYEVSYEEGFEPYIVTRKEGLPLYNVSFLGGFRDKVEHTLVLNASGYSFTVIPDHFAVHFPHHREPRPPYYKCSIQPYNDLRIKLGVMPPPTTTTTPSTTPGSTPKKKKTRRIVRVIRRVRKKVPADAVPKTS